MIDINNPIWNGGKRKIGIADWKIGNDNFVRILCKRKDGNMIYSDDGVTPNVYYISGETLRKNGTPMVLKSGVRLICIELWQFEKVEKEVINE